HQEACEHATLSCHSVASAPATSRSGSCGPSDDPARLGGSAPLALALSVSRDQRSSCRRLSLNRHERIRTAWLYRDGPGHVFGRPCIVAAAAAAGIDGERPSCSAWTRRRNAGAVV